MPLARFPFFSADLLNQTELPTCVSRCAEELYEMAEDLTMQNRPLAVRLLLSAVFTHPQPAVPANLLTNFYLDVDLLKGTELPTSVSRSAEELFEIAVDLTIGDVQNRPLAVRLFLSLFFTHPEPAVPVRALSNLYMDGTNGVEQDLEKYLSCLKWGVELGDDECCYRAACAYRRGFGTDVDLDKASSLFEKLWNEDISCSWEIRLECGLALAEIHTDSGEEEKGALAILILEEIRLTPEVGVDATIQLGELLRHSGFCNLDDKIRARSIYREALDLEGSGEIHFELAWMLEHGEGGPALLSLALAYYNAASELGVEGASIQALEVRMKMKNEQ